MPFFADIFTGKILCDRDVSRNDPYHREIYLSSLGLFFFETTHSCRNIKAIAVYVECGIFHKRSIRIWIRGSRVKWV